MMERRVAIILLVVLCVFRFFVPSAVADIRGLPTINVLAASSLTDVMTEVARTYSKRTGITVMVTYGNTSELSELVIEGGEANIFIGDKEENVRQLKQLGLVDVYSITNLAKNRLVLVAAKGHSIVEAAKGEGKEIEWWLRFLSQKSAPITLFVSADYNIVPLGWYSSQLLKGLGVWEALRPLLLPANDARHALYMVAKGKHVGLVYASDAIDNSELDILALVGDGMHEPIVYQAAVLASEHMTYARDFLEFLKTDEVKALLVKHHFVLF